MNLLDWYKKAGAGVMTLFRMDLQLHFFWGFLLTLLGVFWYPLVTVVKEFLDLWSKKQWCWFDFWWGMTGCAAAMLFLYFSPCP